MIRPFSDLSFPFVMDLYRIRLKAERRGDTLAIESLKQHYPELFSVEFEDFIRVAIQVAGSKDLLYGENFSNLFQVNQPTIKKLNS